MAKMVKYYKGNLVEFDVLKLVDFYDPILRKPTQRFEFVDTVENGKLASYIAFSLAETLSKLQGIGLSANQVGLPWRVCALNMGKEIWTMFNPEIVEKSEVTSTEFQEGCLSYPGLYIKIPRPNHIKVRFQAIGGQTVEQEFDGLTAVCIQHEIDHLDGIMFTDLISPIKLDMAKKKVKQNLKKLKRAAIEYAQQEIADQQTTETTEQPIIETPKIDIKLTNPEPIKPTTPEKFVYNIG